MIDLDQASKRIAEVTRPCAMSKVPLRQALGFVLAEAITSPLDSPPHDKSQVDGFAVRTGDIAAAGTPLAVIESVTAGQVPSLDVAAGQACRIMTGAPIPHGADAVVMVERTRTERDVSRGEERVFIEIVPSRGQNIMPRGDSMRRGDTILRPGCVLRGVEIGLLAECGVAEVPVVRRPRVAIISTGNELVPWDQTPGPGQIRNSNGPMLEALARQAGADVVSVAWADDTLPTLTSAIGQALEADVVLLSGGVSAGVLDLVPEVLRQLGVREVFHKVRLKPGKPLWFGVRDAAERPTLVFGLPGNPVSSLVCFELFARPALMTLAGGRPMSRSESVSLSTSFQHRGDRPTFFPGKLCEQASGRAVQPVAWHGSGDLRALADADVLIEFPPGDYELQPGTAVVVRPLAS